MILCAIRYVPVSGHFPESEITRGLAESDRILIWYAPLGETGYFIPYRVLLTTSDGRPVDGADAAWRLTLPRRLRLLLQSAGRGLRFVPPS